MEGLPSKYFLSPFFRRFSIQRDIDAEQDKNPPGPSPPASSAQKLEELGKAEKAV